METGPISAFSLKKMGTKYAVLGALIALRMHLDAHPNLSSNAKEATKYSTELNPC